MTCQRHPFATGDRLCPVCLFEEALASRHPSADGWKWLGAAEQPPAVKQLTIYLPLGLSASASVFLARQESPPGGLLRLKTWHATAPDDFLDSVAALQQRLSEHAEPCFVAPLAACVDVAGRPWVLSDFRQGVPLLDAVRAGGPAPDAATGLMRQLSEVMRRAHDRGLAHGSLGPGNVIVQPELDTAFLVDFGLSALLGRSSPVAAQIAADCAGLQRLSEAVTARIQPPV